MVHSHLRALRAARSAPQDAHYPQHPGKRSTRMLRFNYGSFFTKCISGFGPRRLLRDAVLLPVRHVPVEARRQSHQRQSLVRRLKTEDAAEDTKTGFILDSY